ncbi:hypothetical protein [Caballeronia sp. DA-9]|uniref:hypothetical protein n=1 Tax=Caballeronia sp. DA-9 TaxID=3436237 RepID=UPI003F66C09B
MTRLYDATWDETYVLPRTDTVSEDYFHGDNGYDAIDIQRIDALRVGEQVELDNGHHLVKRIQ